MGVILTTPTEIERWMTSPASDALKNAAKDSNETVRKAAEEALTKLKK